MADRAKVVVNLSTGIGENPEKAMLAYFAAESALEAGHQVLMFLSLDAVRIGLPGEIAGVVPCKGCPALDKLHNQVTRLGAEFYACPVCLDARDIPRDSLVSEVRPAGTAKMIEWIGPQAATVFNF